MPDMELISIILLLLLVANGIPIVARNLFRGLADWPIDGGYVAADGYRLLGDTKTWRGLLLSVVGTAMIAPLLGYSATTGALFSLSSLCGDLLSSFIKRRTGRAPSSRATGLDQLPEAIFPLLVLHDELQVDVGDTLIIVPGFMIIEIVLSRVLYRLRIRNRPY